MTSTSHEHLPLRSDDEEGDESTALLIKTPSKKREILKARLIYTFYFGSNAAITAYLPVFYRQLGMNNVQTGILASINPFCKLVGAPLWGGISDRTGKHKGILLTAVAVYTLLVTAIYPFSLLPNTLQGNCSSSSNTTATEAQMVLTNKLLAVTNGNHSSSANHSSCANSPAAFLGNQTKFWLLFVLATVAYFFMATITPIIDATVVTMATDIDYGKQRLWGAAGFGIGGLVSGIAASNGKMTAQEGEKVDFLPSFIIFFVLNALVFGVCLSLKAVEGRKPYNQVLKHLKVLLTTPRLVVVVMVIFIMGISSGVITWFLFLFLKDLGGSQALLGISIAVCCVSEILVFMVTTKMVSYLGNTKILFLCLIVFAGRLVGYSYLQDPWLVLTIELLHGFTYAVMWSACVSYATEISPPEVVTTVVGLMTGVHFGLGWGVGSVLGGVVYQYYGPRVLFRACAVACGFGMVLQFIAEIVLKKN